MVVPVYQLLHVDNDVVMIDYAQGRPPLKLNTASSFDRI